MLAFDVAYGRPDEAFVYLRRDDVGLMLQQADGPGRRFRTAELIKSFGRGSNFQIQVANSAQLYETARTAKAKIVIDLEERWYKVVGVERGNEQFVVADPDGFLLRFFTDLDERNDGQRYE